MVSEEKLEPGYDGPCVSAEKMKLVLKWTVADFSVEK